MTIVVVVVVIVMTRQVFHYIGTTPCSSSCLSNRGGRQNTGAAALFGEL